MRSYFCAVFFGSWAKTHYAKCAAHFSSLFLSYSSHPYFLTSQPTALQYWAPFFFLAHSLQGMLKRSPPTLPYPPLVEGSRKNTTLFFISKLSSVEDFWTWVTKCAETLWDLYLNDRVLSWPLEFFWMIESDFVAFGSCFKGSPFLNPQWPAKWVELTLFFDLMQIQKSALCLLIDLQQG